MKRFYGFAKFMLYAPAKVLLPTTVVNKENFPKSGSLITVTNHLSWADIPVLAMNIKGFRHFLAKKELGKSKAMFKLAKLLGVVLLDRGKADMSAMRECIGYLKNGEGLSIFPEGTRNKTDDAIKEVKAGVTLLAIKGNAPIVPAVIHAKPRLFRRSYLYIGKPFFLSEFANRRLDSATLEQAADIVEEQMRLAKEYIDDYVLNKRWKQIKVQRKQKNMRFKKMYKQAKKQYAQYLKGSRGQKV